MNRHKTLSAGLTLVEMAVVLLIGGILMAAATTMLINYLYESRMMITQNRMQDIDNAIIQYMNVNGTLPCVASLTTTQDVATFGTTITASVTPSPGYCFTAAKTSGGTFAVTGTSPSPVAASNTTAGEVIVGAVPVRTLGLSDQDIADAWGDRFVYAVTDTLTTAGSYDQTQGSIAVKDSTGGDVALPPGSAQYAIVSYGPDRAGAYTLAGVASATTCPTGALEGPNCTLPPTGKITFVKTTLNSGQTGAGSMYDDYVTFHTQMTSTGTVPTGIVAPFAVSSLPPPPPAPASPCPAGWGTYSTTGTACTAVAGSYICCLKE